MVKQTLITSLLYEVYYKNYYYADRIITKLLATYGRLCALATEKGHKADHKIVCHRVFGSARVYGCPSSQLLSYWPIHLHCTLRGVVSLLWAFGLFILAVGVNHRTGRTLVSTSNEANHVFYFIYNDNHFSQFVSFQVTPQ